VLPLIEAKLASFDARPHWAKVFTMAPSRLESLYTHMPAFRELLQLSDPGGKFRNEYLDRNIFPA
jgi:alditol oxidase